MLDLHRHLYLLRSVVDDWYESWQFNATEQDFPPDYIRVIRNELAGYGWVMDDLDGVWRREPSE